MWTSASASTLAYDFAPIFCVQLDRRALREHLHGARCRRLRHVRPPTPSPSAACAAVPEPEFRREMSK